MSYGGNLGAAGTRVTKRLGSGDEIWTYVWQSIVGAFAIDFALTLVLLGCMVAGWWSLSLFLGVVGFLVGVIVLVFGRPGKKWVRLLFGSLWVVGVLIPFVPLFESGRFLYLLGQLWHGMIVGGAALIWKQFQSVALLPLWVYVVAGIVLVTVWIKADWRAMVALAVLLIVGGIVALSDGDEWLEAWRGLKHLLIPYSWPVIGFALLLALVMGKEMLFPSLEWTFQPVSLEELRGVGLISLWLPGLFGKSGEVAQPGQFSERRVRVESKENAPGELAEETYTYLPDSNSARDFYRALSNKRPFTISEAQRWHVGRKTFEKKIRNVFLDRGWAVWKDEDHHDQGLSLTPDGNEKIEALVLGDPRH